MSTVSIVTGGSRGIGKAIVEELKQKGLVLEISRSGRQSEGVYHLPLDLSLLRFDEVTEFLTRHKYTVQNLVLNAGMAFTKTIEQTTIEDLEKIFKVNVFANYALLKIVKPFLVKGSRIVFFSSLAGLERVDKFPGLSAYAMTKACMVNLCESVSSEFPEQMVHVICPGGVETEMFHAVAPRGFHAKFEPTDVAKLVLTVLNSKSTGVNWVLK